jgi:hypothetical protein
METIYFLGMLCGEISLATAARVWIPALENGVDSM